MATKWQPRWSLLHRSCNKEILRLETLYSITNEAFKHWREVGRQTHKDKSELESQVEHLKKWNKELQDAKTDHAACSEEFEELKLQFDDQVNKYDNLRDQTIVLVKDREIFLAQGEFSLTKLTDEIRELHRYNKELKEGIKLIGDTWKEECALHTRWCKDEIAFQTGKKKRPRGRPFSEPSAPQVNVVLPDNER